MAINESVSSTDAVEDGVLVRTTLNGDTSAYAGLYDRYAQLVRAICHDTTRNMTDTADLSQEVFLRAFRLALVLRSSFSAARLIIAGGVYLAGASVSAAQSSLLVCAESTR